TRLVQGGGEVGRVSATLHFTHQFRVATCQVGQARVEKQDMSFSERVVLHTPDVVTLSGLPGEREDTWQLAVFRNEMLSAQFFHRNAIDTGHVVLRAYCSTGSAHRPRPTLLHKRSCRGNSSTLQIG